MPIKQTKGDSTHSSGQGVRGTAATAPNSAVPEADSGPESGAGSQPGCETHGESTLSTGPTACNGLSCISFEGVPESDDCPRVPADLNELTKLFHSIHIMFNKVTDGAGHTDGEGTDGSIKASGVVDIMTIVVELCCKFLGVDATTKVLEDFEILDLGCGCGRLVFMLALMNFRACNGIELTRYCANVSAIMDGAMKKYWERSVVHCYGPMNIVFDDLGSQHSFDACFPGEDGQPHPLKIVISFCKGITCICDVLQKKVLTDPGIVLAVLVSHKSDLNKYEAILQPEFDFVKKVKVGAFASSSSFQAGFYLRRRISDCHASLVAKATSKFTASNSNSKSNSESNQGEVPVADETQLDGSDDGKSQGSFDGSCLFDGRSLHSLDSNGNQGQEGSDDEKSQGSFDGSCLFDGRSLDSFSGSDLFKYNSANSLESLGSSFEVPGASSEVPVVPDEVIVVPDGSPAVVNTQVIVVPDGSPAVVNTQVIVVPDGSPAVSDEVLVVLDDEGPAVGTPCGSLFEAFGGRFMDKEERDIMKLVSGLVDKHNRHIEWIVGVKRGRQYMEIFGETTIAGERTEFTLCLGFGGKKTQLNEPLFRMGSVMAEFANDRAPNNCIPIPVRIFNYERDFFAQARYDLISVNLLAMERLLPYIGDTAAEAREAFLTQGRITHEWQYAVKHVADAITFIHSKGIAHLHVNVGCLKRRAGADRVVLTEFGFCQRKEFVYMYHPPDCPEAWNFRSDALIFPNLASIVAGFKREANVRPLRILGLGCYGSLNEDNSTESVEFEKEETMSIDYAIDMDIYAFGILCLRPILPIPIERASVVEYRRRFSELCEREDLAGFFGFVVEKLPTVASDTARLILGRILKFCDNSIARLFSEDEDMDGTNRIMHIRAETVFNLTRLAFECLGGTLACDSTGCNTKFMSVFFSGFMMTYIPVDTEEEMKIIVKGELVEGDETTGQKPTVLICLPGFLGLNVFCLFDTNPKVTKIVGKYGGLIESIVKPNCAPGLQKANMHTLPTDTHQINGCPGRALPLALMCKAAMAASLYASSRIRPDKGRAKSANSKLSRMGKIKTETHGHFTIGYIPMECAKITKRGDRKCWDYNWDRACGMNASTQEKIDQAIGNYEMANPRFVADIVDEHRARLLSLGKWKDDPVK